MTAIFKVMPVVQIRQTYALIGIDADMGQMSIRQPGPAFEMRTERPVQTIEQPLGQLTIDQSRAWDALGSGNHLETMSRIYSQGPGIALRAIGEIVEKGNRLAAIHLGGNPIADMAREIRYEFGQHPFAGPATYDNVDVHYAPQRPRIEVQEGKVHVNSHPNPVEYEYHRGKLDIYMRQYNKVEFTPPPLVDQLV